MGLKNQKLKERRENRKARLRLLIQRLLNLKKEVLGLTTQNCSFILVPSASFFTSSASSSFVVADDRRYRREAPATLAKRVRFKRQRGYNWCVRRRKPPSRWYYPFPVIAKTIWKVVFGIGDARCGFYCAEIPYYSHSRSSPRR
ncbi:hypothetical protein SLEP1_g56756 [Rubroshorea leprosula]|uniref:Uncharacterized protein n=1 Tax=Rubroshorea leprosula TaxID=152421 RepID=A0AAV5MJE7_9ROSI|nr:hypothetical protein SLEP1_g56756 [Rubroshorea leprosula]